MKTTVHICLLQQMLILRQILLEDILDHVDIMYKNSTIVMMYFGTDVRMDTTLLLIILLSYVVDMDGIEHLWNAQVKNPFNTIYILYCCRYLVRLALLMETSIAALF